MSPQEKIAKLEGLLARVKERAEAPRPHGAATFPQPRAEASEPARIEPAITTSAAAAVVMTEAAPPSRAGTQPPPSDGSGWSAPPPAADDPVLETSMEELDSDMDVEVSAEVVEVDIDIDEPGIIPTESGAHPVAQDLMSNGTSAHPDAVVEVEASETVEAEQAHEEHEEVEADAALAARATPPANEVVEPEPSSSPRPIVSDKPEAYEAESAPRHTPPPESGKQVAAPSVKPEPPRVSSLPPDSLPDHTLIGGWREPGAAFRDPKIGGPAVRVPAPAAPPPPEPAAKTAARTSSLPSALPPTTPGGATGAPQERLDLGPQATKPVLSDTDASVATFEGAAPRAVPATFGELLDATLAL